MSQIAIVEAFADLPDTRRTAGQRHHQALCLALFTLGVAAGNRGFLAIGDWLKAHHEELVTLFQPPLGRLPSYSTIRRTLLRLEYQAYSGCLSKFFGIQPMPGETIALDGKVLRLVFWLAALPLQLVVGEKRLRWMAKYCACLTVGFKASISQGETIALDGKVLRRSYECPTDDPRVDSHPAIMLVSAYIVERGLILEPYEVDSKTNEITAIPAFIEQMALKGVVFAFDAISTQKNCSDHH